MSQQNFILVFWLLIIVTNGELSGSADQASESRCPDSVAEPGVYMFADKKLCNVYHECECVSDNSTRCSVVRSNVCPIGMVFLNVTSRCEPIELHGCDSSYLQSVGTGAVRNATLDQDEETRVYGPAEPVNITGITDFQCPQGANDRFADSHVCNLFHVCVSRAGQTFDQPFLCPFSTIFRYIDSTTMYCDKRNKNDCVGKAFYQSTHDESLFDKSVLIASDNNATHCVNSNEVLEDKLFCNVFHVCRDGRDLAYMCDNQLLFNPIAQICDYPINVVCYNKKIFKLNDNEQKNSIFSAPLIMTKTNKLSPSVNLFKKNGSLVQIYQAKFRLECPHGGQLRNYVQSDKIFCNVYHECYGDSGDAFVCAKNEAFDAKVGACAPEHLVDCSGKLVLTESGQRAAASTKQAENKLLSLKRMGSSEQLVNGISFDCRGRPNGHWRDTQFCDVFHACVNNEQKKTYSCAQLGGERTYFDEETRRCEFVKTKKVSPCQTNSYFKSSAGAGAGTKLAPMVSRESSEGWRQFIRSREAFSCATRMDGFYASRWCNVFYRCFLGVKTEFLCPKMVNSDRLWWVQHGSSQETPQTSAACVWPCETKKKCDSPGGSIVEAGDGKYDESGDEAERVWRISNCAGDSGLDDVFRLADADKSCQGQPEGAFFASQYCNVFHRCINGKRKDFQCPKATNTPYDLWWNDEKSQCDWPCKVNCNKQIYASEKSASQIQNEDRSLNEAECRASKLFETKSFSFAQKNNYNNNNNNNRHSFIRYTNPTATTTTTTTATTTATTTTTTTATTTIRRIDARQIVGALPDENFVCLNSDGLLVSVKYCNVFYDCRRGKVSAVFYCDQGYFDTTTRSCVPSTMTQCAYNPQLMYPYVALVEQSPPEDIRCSNSIGAYIIHSNRFCNIYYVCDGQSTKPSTYRCYDRDKMQDAVFNRELRRCEPRKNGVAKCEGEILPIQVRYQSSPIDHNKYVDLEPLSCRADQQYLAEHEKYCNLYHSCILGKYQMYACVTIGSFDKTSYFYYTNGDCAAPNADQCGPNKAIYPYEKLFLNSQSAENAAANRFTPVISPSLSYRGQSSYSSISLKAVLPYTPVCSTQPSKYLIPSGKYCNVFFECVNGKITTFACIDSTTGLFSGIFDPSIRACKPYNQIDCPSNSLYTPEFDSGLRNEVKYLADYSFRTESNFSCADRANGYYESEWCNVFYRCVNGKRIDAKCSSGNTNGDYLLQYDLWWEHQNSSYDSNRPLVFAGLDEEAKCEWPCKVKCDKPVWLHKGQSQPASIIRNHDFELHPECFGNAAQLSRDEPTDQNYNKNNKNKINEYHAQDLDSVNPSGFYCEMDGTFRDPIYCNLFHVCNGQEKKTYQCKPMDPAEHNGMAIFDQERGFCVSKEDGFEKCNGVVFDANFMNLPAYRDLPTPIRPCVESGVFRAFDQDAKYCDLYYWCEKAFSEPLYFYCDFATYGHEPAFFNFDTRQCESSYKVRCDQPNKLYAAGVYQPKVKSMEQKKNQETLDTETALKNFLQASPYMMQIVSGLLDPAPGYLNLPSSQFQTNFKCPLNAPGYYPNSDYCDIFHYCYSNGQFKTYVCASMQNKYQLWWSHQTEPGRRDNIFCDWPCNLIGPNTVCPSHKRVLMRDRQQISGGISQKEVLSSTCQNTQAAQAHMGENWNNERSNNVPVINSGTFISLNPITKSNPSVVSIATISAYVPCTITSEWYSSPQIIKCSNEHRLFGFAPDPKDCTRFYRCDQANRSESHSTGSLYSCIAGFYWDQTKRMCVPPSESSCDPMKIVKKNLKDPSSQSCPGYTCSQMGLSVENQMKMVSGKPNSYYRCDGECAIEFVCPLDLIFDNLNQRCEWLAPQFRMASLKASASFNKILQHQKRMNLDNEIKASVMEQPLLIDKSMEKKNQTSNIN